MNGPHELGTHTPQTPASQYDWESSFIARGQTYRVTRSFCDADGDHHHVGEEWLFIMSMFNRFDDELTLCVRSVSDEEWRIPLIWKPENQQDIIEDFKQYIAPVSR
jgi:hypothetical protein